MTETVGQRVHRLRTALGLSQRDIAEPGVSYAYISRIEAGAREPSTKALRKLAPKLGVSVEYLEHGTERTTTDDRIDELRARVDPDTISVFIADQVTLGFEHVVDGVVRPSAFAAPTVTEAVNEALAMFAALDAIAEDREQLQKRERQARDLLEQARMRGRKETDDDNDDAGA